MFWICQGYLPDGFRWDRKQDVHQPMIFLRNHRRDVFTQKEPKIDRDYRLISIGMVVWTAPTKSHRCSSCSPLVFVVKYGIHHFLTKPFTRYHGFNSRIEKREIRIINPYDQAWNINSTISQFLQKYPPMGKHKVSPQQTSRLYSHFFHSPMVLQCSMTEFNPQCLNRIVYSTHLGIYGILRAQTYSSWHVQFISISNVVYIYVYMYIYNVV